VKVVEQVCGWHTRKELARNWIGRWWRRGAGRRGFQP
jgi:hypothetical protein